MLPLDSDHHDFGMLRIGLDNVDLEQEFELLQIDESFFLALMFRRSLSMPDESVSSLIASNELKEFTKRKLSSRSEGQR